MSEACLHPDHCLHGGCYGKPASSAGIYYVQIRIPREKHEASCLERAVNG